MDLDAFEKLARSRRSVRRFKPDPIPEELLRRLLDVSHWAPSGYNLQPTHFVVVTDPALKEPLCRACLDQRQVREAPATVVFTGDRRVYHNNLSRTLQADLDCGALNKEYEAKLRQFIGLSFDSGPCGLGWLWKSVAPLARFRTPIPSVPVVHMRYWLTKQVMLSAMVFMLAASAAGLATVPMEGFDEVWVRKVLNIPRSHIVPLVVPVGYTVDANLKKARLPLESMIHMNGW
jgi:nitroreductase